METGKITKYKITVKSLTISCGSRPEKRDDSGRIVSDMNIPAVRAGRRRKQCQFCALAEIPLFLAREAKTPNTDNTEKMMKPVLIPARSLE